MMIEPSAPIAAASVGVAQPSRMVPSTAKMRMSGGTSATAVITSLRTNGGSFSSGEEPLPVLRADGAAHQDVEDEKPREQQPREQHAHEQTADIHLGDRSEDDHDHGRRNDRAERAAGADGAGDEPLVVGVAQHHRNREQADHGFRRAHHAARGGEDHAQDDGADRQAAGEPARPHVDRLEQPLRDARALHQRAHEDEQRHRAEHVGGRHLIDLLGEDVGRERREVEPQGPEHEGDREQRERHREPHEDHDHQGREHPQGEFRAHFRPSTGGGAGGCRPARTMIARTTCTVVCRNSSTTPATRLNLNGQMIGFQADSPEVSSAR